MISFNKMVIDNIMRFILQKIGAFKLLLLYVIFYLLPIVNAPASVLSVADYPLSIQMAYTVHIRLKGYPFVSTIPSQKIPFK